MLHRVGLLLVGVNLAWAGQVRAEDALTQALALVPEDAVAFVCAPTVKQVDDDFQQAIKTLGLEAYLPPPWSTPSAGLGQFLHLADALDPSGPLVGLLMPAATPFEFQRSWAWLVPVKDTGAALQTMGARAGEGDVWTWAPAPEAEPLYLTAVQKRLVMGASAEVVKTVAAGKTDITSKLEPADLSLFQELDLVGWLDAGRIIEQFRMQIDSFMNMGLMLQAGGSPGAAKQVETTKQQVKMFFDGTSALILGLGSDQAGLTMRFGFRVKPGSELATRMKAPPPSEDLLRGLPADNYMLVAGEVLDPEQTRKGLEFLDPTFAMFGEQKGVDKEQVGRIKSILQEWAPLITGAQLAVNSIEPGPDGVFGAAMVMRVTDSGRWLSLLREAAEVGLKMLAAEGLADNEDVQMLRSALTYQNDAEELAGVKLDHLKLDLAKMEDVEEEDVEDAQKILGEDGVLVRIGAASPKQAVMTFGGGAAYTTKMIELLRKDAAAVEADPGILKTAVRLPKERYLVGFMAVDRILGCIANGAKALDEEEEFPVRMAKLEAPLAVSATGAEDFARIDLFVPTELMVAGKDTIMTLMGTAGAEEAEKAPDSKPQAAEAAGGEER